MQRGRRQERSRRALEDIRGVALTIASRVRTAPLPSSGRLSAAKLENAVSDSLCGHVAALRAAVGVLGLRGGWVQAVPSWR